MDIKKISHTFAIFIFLTFLFGLSGFTHAAQKNVTGYAWSSNIGWISFQGSNYGVVMDDTTGNLSGYAWSSNIGWIRFTPNLFYPCPNTHGPCQPNVNLSTGDLTGWARACSATASKNCEGPLASDGYWDGWIYLGSIAGISNTGVTHNSVSGLLNGYAWGSNILGWIKFNNGGNGVVIPPNSSPTCSISASVIPGEDDINLSWTINNDPGQQYSISRNGSYFGLEPTSSGNSIDSSRPLGTYSYAMSRIGGGGAMCSSNSVTVTNIPAGVGKLWLGTLANQAVIQRTIDADDHVDVRWDVASLLTANPDLICTAGTVSGALISGWHGTQITTPFGPNAVHRISGLTEGVYKLNIGCVDTETPANNKTTNTVTIIVSDGDYEEE